MIWLFITLILVFIGLVLYWLLVITEGVFLGRRVVVWLYDWTAHKYDGIKQYDVDAEQFFVIRPLLTRLRHIPNPLVLDVATGTGRVPYYLLEAPRFNGRIIGLDPSANMLEVAAVKIRPFPARTLLVQQTADGLPFPDNTFDAITCLESLEFFPSEEDALREICRVLKSNGIMLVTRRRGWEAQTFIGRYRNQDQYEEFLLQLGFSNIETFPWQIDYDQLFAKKM